MLDAWDDSFLVARNSGNAGARVNKFLRRTASGNTGRAYNQRFDLHVYLQIVEKRGRRRGAGDAGVEPVSDHVHQNFHFLAAWIEERTETFLDDRFWLDSPRDDFFDR